MDKIKIEYTTDGGSSWDTIRSSYSAQLHSLVWVVPNKPSSECAVRITDVSDIQLRDSSKNAFTISGQPTVSLMTPNGGELLQMGKDYTITWTSFNVPSVKLYYSTNSGGQWTYFGTSNPGSNSFVWTITEHSTLNTSQYCRIRIVSSTSTNVSDMSDQDFTICRLKLLSPAGNENWAAGSTQEISWVTDLYYKTKLEYSIDGGRSWLLLKDSINNLNNRYSFIVPEINSNQCRFKISTIDKPQLSDSTKSNTSLYILRLLSLTGGETIRKGTNYSIRWRAPQLTGVKLEYSTDDGINWANIIAVTNAERGEYQWRIPGTVSDKCRIRISNSENSNQYAVSQSAFTIYDPVITLNSPNGGEVFVGGSTQSISWIASNADKIRIQYTFDNGTNWLLIADSVSAGSSPYSWQIPSMHSTTARVKLTDLKNNISDISNAPFTITMTGIVVTSPNGGERWQAGSQQNISWMSSNISTLKLEYTTNNGTSWNLIPGAGSVAAELGSFNWTLPAISSAQSKVKITSTINTNLTDQSDNTFTISSLLLTSPLMNDKWQAQTNQLIKWSSQNISSIKIEYSTDAGISWNIITNSTSAAAGSYNWTVPNIQNDRCQIRITDVANQSISSRNEGVFSIYKFRIVLTSPNGNENWQAGKDYNITWNSYAVGKIKLYYSTNNGTGWVPIQFGLKADSGKYLWRVPDRISKNCMVKITDVDNSGFKDSSDDRFTISQLKLTVPNGGEIWEADSIKQIKWSFANINLIKLEYSTNNGSNWNVIASNIDAKLNKFDWHLPKLTTDECRVRISSSEDGIINDGSDQLFTISNEQRILLASPAGGSLLYTANNYAVSWQSMNVKQVAIYFSSDNGTTWSSIAGKEDASKKIFNWIPAVPSSSGKIKILAVDNPSCKAESQSFTVLSSPSLSIIYPNGDEKLEAGKEYLIQWASSNIINLKIQYQTGNNLWETIADNVSASSGIYTWKTPIQNSSECRVRVISKELTSITDQSDNTFEIKVIPVNLLSPNGDELIPINSDFSIKWKRFDNEIERINLYYSDNLGVSWKLIKRDVNAAEEFYNWRVPALTSKNCLVRITDSRKGGPVYDKSEKKFSIYSEQEDRQWLVWTDNYGGLDNSFITESIGFLIRSQGSTSEWDPMKYRLSKTSNGGIAWYDFDHYAYEPFNFSKSKNGSAISFTYGSTVVILTENSRKPTVFQDHTGYGGQRSEIHRFYSSNFVDENFGVVIGKLDDKEGLVLKTTNSGVDWEYRYISDKKLNSVYLLDETYGWIIAEGKELYFTTDGGSTWTQKTNLPFQSITQVYFISPQTGFIISSNVLYRTTNGGDNWSGVCYAPGTLIEVSFKNSTDGYVIGTYGSMYGTIDGGTSWFEVDIDASGDLRGLEYLNSIPYVTDGTGRLFRPQNRKVSLIEPEENDQLDPIEPLKIRWDCTPNINTIGVKFLQNNQPVELYTNDNMVRLSASWTEAELNVPLPSGTIDIILFDILNENKVYSRKTVTVGSLSASSWKRKLNGITDYQKVNANSSYMLSNNKLYFSSDMGQTWQKRFDTLRIGFYKYTPYNIFFINNNVGFLCASRYYQHYTSWNEGEYEQWDKIFKTTDGGVSWSEKFSKVTSDEIDGNYSIERNPFGLIYMLNEGTGFINYNGKSMRTTDGFVTLTELDNIHPKTIQFVNSNTGWILTVWGKLMKTTDGGAEWFSQLDNKPLLTFHMLNENNGWAAGDNGLILKTTNGGITWSQQFSNTDKNITSINFINPDVGYAIGKKTDEGYVDRSVILKTTNSGANWEVLLDHSRSYFKEVLCYTPDLVFIFDHESILYTTTGGRIPGFTKEEQPEKVVPEKFSLHQNYPNPFNPSTRIDYELPKDSRITLEVFSMLGERMAVLADGVETAGYHTETWDAAHLASGIYLLRISAETLESRETYVKTLKMILVK